MSTNIEIQLPEFVFTVYVHVTSGIATFCLMTNYRVYPWERLILSHTLKSLIDYISLFMHLTLRSSYPISLACLLIMLLFSLTYEAISRGHSMCLITYILVLWLFHTFCLLFKNVLSTSHNCRCVSDLYLVGGITPLSLFSAFIPVVDCSNELCLLKNHIIWWEMRAILICG